MDTGEEAFRDLLESGDRQDGRLGVQATPSSRVPPGTVPPHDEMLVCLIILVHTLSSFELEINWGYEN